MAAERECAWRHRERVAWCVTCYPDGYATEDPEALVGTPGPVEPDTVRAAGQLDLDAIPPTVEDH